MSAAAEVGAPRPARSFDRLLVAVVLAAVALVLVIQLWHLDELLSVSQPFTAGFAKALVGAYALAVAILCLLALLLPATRLWLMVAGTGTLAGSTLLATLTVGAEAWSFASAVFVMTACWQLGWWSLRLLGLPRLAASWPTAWLAGVALLGMVLLFAGRIGLLRWWTFGVPVLLLGASAFRWMPVWSRSVSTAWERVTSDRLGAAAASVALLLGGLATVWAAAPEIMYDPLYAKAWLPSEWARMGSIEPLTTHAALNTSGFAQVIAVPGHLVGAAGIGRYLQWLAALGAVATVWWACRRSPWAPLAAAAVALAPQMFWQSTTAFDDALLVLAVLGLALGIVRSLGRSMERPFVIGAAIGFLAGACVDMKLHLAALVAGMTVGWLIARGRRSTIAVASGLIAGGLLSLAPPLILRWADLGNPVHPAWNNVFRSEFWPARNEQFNMPFMADPGGLGPLDALWATFVHPLAVSEAAAIGSAGVLTAAIVVALLLCLPARRRLPGLSVLWCGLVLAIIAWYLQFRYLRYLLPAGAIAVVAVTWALPLRRPGRLGTVVGVGGLAVSAILMWPSTVAMFWNVPGRDIPWEAAFHKVSDRDYETRAMVERPLLELFDRIAPPGAMAVGDAHQRIWLSDGRDLSPPWETLARLEATGGVPEPDAGPARLRALGIEWMIVAPGGSTLAQPYFQALANRHGALVDEHAGWRLYRVVGPSTSDPER